MKKKNHLLDLASPAAAWWYDANEPDMPESCQNEHTSWNWLKFQKKKGGSKKFHAPLRILTKALAV